MDRMCTVSNSNMPVFFKGDRFLKVVARKLSGDGVGMVNTNLGERFVKKEYSGSIRPTWF